MKVKKGGDRLMEMDTREVWQISLKPRSDCNRKSSITRSPAAVHPGDPTCVPNPPSLCTCYPKRRNGQKNTSEKATGSI